ncbi:MAG: hypothetical protein BVN34_00760 [Proteobacteria bacterium ST_bin12]|nr:MAG: hypothetical protein BVN34_00760 [Proteobacteria bacterium ST_bin12]
MNKYRFFLPIGFFIFFAAITFYAAMVVADTAHEIAIAETIKQQWQKPNRPVSVPVVAVSHDFAIADWIQEPKGGKALLRFNAGHWQTLMCGDVNLMQQKRLEEAGVPAKDAQQLIASLTQSEAQLTADQQTTINSFQGIVDLLKTPHQHTESH